MSHANKKVDEILRAIAGAIDRGELNKVSMLEKQLARESFIDAVLVGLPAPVIKWVLAKSLHRRATEYALNGVTSVTQGRKIIQDLYDMTATSKSN